jgi:hypothetical protein
MIELPTKRGAVYCELITIQDQPFIFFSSGKDIQMSITYIYPVRYYSIEDALTTFLLQLTKYENR